MQTIRVEVPRSTRHPVTNLRVKHSQGESVTEVDVTAMSVIEIELPEGVTPEEVEIAGEYCDARGQRDEGMDPVPVKSAGKAETPKDPPTPDAPKDPPPAAVTDPAPAAPVADDKPAVDAAPVADAPATDVAPAADAPAADAAPAVDVPPKKTKSKAS